MNEPKKLKRGLRDISPLFDGEAKPEEHGSMLVTPVAGLRVLSLFSPDFNGDSRMLAQILGLKLGGNDHPCSILRIEKQEFSQESKDKAPSNPEILGPHLKRLHLGLGDLDRICETQHEGEMSFLGAQTILFDFDPCESHLFKRIIPILDQWIVLIQPTLEGLSEAYKLIKASVALNPGLEYFLALDALPDDSCANELYENLSDMISRRLHVQLNWLGCMPISKGVRAFSWELHLDQLTVKSIEKIDAVEKMAMAAYLQPPSKQEAASILKHWALKNQRLA